MKKTENSSYNRIIEYIHQNPNLDSKLKRRMISYATQLYLYNIENIEEETIQNIFNDIRKLNEELKKCEDTSIAEQRRLEELKLLKLIELHCKTSEISLEKISYELDRMYMSVDLKPRKNSSLSFNLYNNLNKRSK